MTTGQLDARCPECGVAYYQAHMTGCPRGEQCERCWGTGLVGGHGDQRECPDCNGSGGAANWRESDVVKQARQMLADFDSPLRPGSITETDWARVLRGVLAERDFIGEWLQRYIDADNQKACGKQTAE